MRKNIDSCGNVLSALPPATRDKNARTHQARGRAIALLAGALCSAPALAELSDTIHPFVAVGYTHDDNLLRQADSPSGNNDGFSDNSRQVQGGLLFERPIGRQVLSGQAKFSRVSFDRYQQLDYNGKDLSAALNWHLLNHLEGHLGSSYAQTLASFSDFHDNQRNLRVQRREYVDGTWRFHPSWQVRGGFTREKYAYDLTAQKYNNRTEDTTEFGVDYLASSGSRVGMQLRHLKGDYPDNFRFGSVVLDNSYDQNEAKANIYWLFSGTTQIQFLGGWVQRKHAFFTVRDDSGINERLIVTWAPLGKLRFTGAGWREFAAAEGGTINSSLNKGVSVAAAWTATAKVRVDASLKNEKRDFSTIPGVVASGDMGDSTRNASLGVTYSPVPQAQLGVNLYRDDRTGNARIGTNSYRANGVSFNATAQF